MFTTGHICNGEVIKINNQKANNSHNETINVQKLATQ